MCHYVASTWQGDFHPLFHSGAPGVPFSCEQLTEAFKRIPFSKASAPSCAPGPCWRIHAHELANIIFPCLQKWWNCTPPFIPQEWKDATLFLMPKPGKPYTRPQHLRPLALQDPIGKAVIGLLGRLARSDCLHRLRRMPQYAYLPYRGVVDAIDRVVRHCQQVRDLTIKYHRTHPADPSTPNPMFFGGVQISLDLTRAFDALPRAALFESLSRLGVDSAVRQLLETWHHGTRYQISHKGFTKFVPTSLGIRQGCQAAPNLWAFFAHRILEDLQRLQGDDWLFDHVTVYADDVHSASTFTSADELEKILIRFGQLLDVLEGTGLNINLAKSRAMLVLHGRGGQTQYGQYAKKAGHGWSLRIPRADGSTTFLPLQENIKYLGVQISYKQWHDRTLQARIQAAHVTYKRLRPWLQHRSKFSFSQRMQIWKATVLNTATFALFTVGATKLGLQKITSMMLNHYRRMSHQHQYRCRITHDDFLKQQQIEHPLVTLRTRGIAELTALQARDTKVPTSDIVYGCRYGKVQDIVQLINDLLTGPIHMDLQPPRELQCDWCLECDWCSELFSMQKHLRHHLTVVHHITVMGRNTFNIQRDSKDGNSTCAHCSHQFYSWKDLQEHIQKNRCTYFDPTQEASDLLKYHQDTARALLSPLNWQGLQLNAELCHFMSKQCILCAKTCPAPREYTRHIRLEHSSLAAAAVKQQAAWTYSNAASPCAFCETSFKHTYQCPVRFRV